MAWGRSDPRANGKERCKTDTCRCAIARACDRAFPPPGPLVQGDDETKAKWRKRLAKQRKRQLALWRKVHRWHPHQLRHNYATYVRKEFGLEAAQVLLGHSKADVTQVYAERDVSRAASVPAKIG